MKCIHSVAIYLSEAERKYVRENTDLESRKAVMWQYVKKL